MAKAEFREPTEYDAQGEYRKTMEINRGPRNIPAALKGRIEAQLINAIHNEKTKLSHNAGVLDKFQTLSPEERRDFVINCKDENLLLGLKVVEEDTDVLQSIVTRLGEVR